MLCERRHTSTTIPNVYIQKNCTRRNNGDITTECACIRQRGLCQIRGFMHQTNKHKTKSEIRREKKKTLNKYSTRKTFTFDAKHTHAPDMKKKTSAISSIDSIYHEVYKDSESEWELNAIR